VERRPGDRDASNGASLVNAAWILLVIGVAGAVAMLARSWARRYQYGDLGTVSQYWIAEQERLGQGQTSQR
jgi:hypothetical protein